MTSLPLKAAGSTTHTNTHTTTTTIHTLVGVVSHVRDKYPYGSRHALELFQVRGRGSDALLQWVGCLPVPVNSVVVSAVLVPGSSASSGSGSASGSASGSGSGSASRSGSVLDGGWRAVLASYGSAGYGVSNENPETEETTRNFPHWLDWLGFLVDSIDWNWWSPYYELAVEFLARGPIHLRTWLHGERSIARMSGRMTRTGTTATTTTTATPPMEPYRVQLRVAESNGHAIGMLRSYANYWAGYVGWDTGRLWEYRHRASATTTSSTASKHGKSKWGAGRAGLHGSLMNAVLLHDNFLYMTEQGMPGWWVGRTCREGSSVGEIESGREGLSKGGRGGERRTGR